MPQRETVWQGEAEGRTGDMTDPRTGKTPSAPDVDQPDGGPHAGEDDQQASGRTPSTPGVDEPDAGSSTSGRPEPA